MKLFLALVLAFSNGFINTSDTSKVITLVDNVTHTSNTIWYHQSLDFKQSFDLYFTIYLGTSKQRGDGATVIFSSSKTPKQGYIGGTGGLLGALDLKDSLIFEMDTYYNTTDSSNPESDRELGLAAKNHSGHIAVVETNNTYPIKHQQWQHDEAITLGDGSKRAVGLHWNAAISTMTFNLEGYAPLHHQVDIESVFGGDTLIDWGFSSANGSQKTNASVEILKYPHQVETSLRFKDDNPESNIYELDLTKTLANDEGPYENLSLMSQGIAITEIKVNGEPHSFVDLPLNLNAYSSKHLKLEITTEVMIDEGETCLSYDYQGKTGLLTQEITKPIAPPEDNEEEVEDSEEPEDIPSVPAPVPPEDLIVIKPIEPIKPLEPSIPIEKVIETPKPIKMANLTKPKVEPKDEAFEFKLSHMRENNGVAINRPLPFLFDSGLYGAFYGGLQEVSLYSYQEPKIIVEHGYEFIGFYDGDELITVDTIERGQKVVAKYRKIPASSLFIDEKKPYLLWLLFILLMTLARYCYKRYKENTKIKISKDLDGGI